LSETVFNAATYAERLAAALLRQMAGDEVHVRTAGSRPSGQIDPMLVEVLDEIGVPVVAEFRKPLYATSVTTSQHA